MNGEKRGVRQVLLHERRAYLNEKRVQSSKEIMQRIIGSQLYKDCDTILTFIPTRIEVDTTSLIEKAFADGKTVAAPRVDKNSDLMDFYRITSFDDLESASFNLLEPKTDCEKITDFSNSICITPGLAYTRKGFRMGFGRGYYDRFLSGYEGISCGVIFEQFILDSLPVDDRDIPTSFVVTEYEIIRTSES